MSNKLELAAEVRALSGKGELRQLRQRGMVPANVYGGNEPSAALQVNGVAFHKLLGHGGSTVILSLRVGTQAAFQVLIKQVYHNPRGGEISHVDFYRVAATEKLKTPVQLQFINEAGVASLSDVTVLRPLNEVMVECLPADLPAAIQVDLSRLKQVGAVIRVGNLMVGPGVTILTDHNEMVAGLHQRASAEKADVAEAKTEG